MTMSWHKQSQDKSPCAECRRRRIRCQKPFPCQYCISQGLEKECLQGSVVKGTRSLKQSSIALHEDIAKMTVRAQELEVALAELYSSVSSEVHPLLVKEAQIRTASPVPGLQRTVEINTNDDSRQAADAGADGLVAAMGMMSINGKQYHGETATSEYLIKENDEKDDQEAIPDLPAKRRLPPLRLPSELILLSVEFPFPPFDQKPPEMDVFLHFLPSYERAVQLVHKFHSYYAWCTMLEPPAHTIENIFALFYPDGVPLGSLQPSDAHHIAVLFMMFLLGTLYDLDLDIETVSIQVEEFHSLARAAMTSYPITDHPSVYGIQAMIYMIWYFRLFPGRRPSSYQWVLTGVLTRVIQSIGLHRDCSANIHDPDERAPVEQTFWEYYCVDIWQSFMFGRPTSMVSAMIDSKMPTKVDVPPGQDPEFFPWKYSFTRLVCDVVLQTSRKDISYKEILKNEQKLRAHYSPSSIAWPPRDVPLPLPDEAVGKTFQRYIMAVWQNVSVMYLHRRWMVDLLEKHKDSDPTTSPHWGSAITAFECARALVHDMRRLWLGYPLYIERMAPFWSHTTSAALVLGALVTRVPGCDFAEDALQHLDETCEMFAEAKESLQPHNCLPALRKSQYQARYAFSKLHDPHGRNGIKEDDTDMSLSPSDTQFPFAFGDSHSSPQQIVSTAQQPVYGPAPPGGFNGPSTGVNGNSFAHRMSAGNGMHSVGMPSSSGHNTNNGYSEQYPEVGWGQLVEQMVTRC